MTTATKKSEKQNPPPAPAESAPVPGEPTVTDTQTEAWVMRPIEVGDYQGLSRHFAPRFRHGHERSILFQQEGRKMVNGPINEHLAATIPADEKCKRYLQLQNKLTDARRELVALERKRSRLKFDAEDMAEAKDSGEALLKRIADNQKAIAEADDRLTTAQQGLPVLEAEVMAARKEALAVLAQVAAEQRSAGSKRLKEQLAGRAKQIAEVLVPVLDEIVTIQRALGIAGRNLADMALARTALDVYEAQQAKPSA